VTLWIVFGVMSLVAVAFVALPWYRQQQKLHAPMATTIVAIVGLSAGLYYYQGSPGLPSGAADDPAMDEVVAALAERLRTWRAPPPKADRGLLAKYARLVSSASKGAVTDEPAGS